MNTNKRALRPGGKPWQLNNTNSSSRKCQLTVINSIIYTAKSSNKKSSEIGALQAAAGVNSWLYRIPTRNLDVYRIERMFKVICVPCTLVYGQGIEDPAPESTVTFHFAGVNRFLAESIARMIEHLNHSPALIGKQRAVGIIRFE